MLKRLGRPLNRVEKVKLSRKKDGTPINVTAADLFVSSFLVSLNFIRV